MKRFKIVIVGNCHIGKTSLAMQYVNKRFSNVFRSTIGCSFFSKSTQLQGKHCQLDIWDTAGQERYRSLLPMYYRDAHIILLCFSLHNTTTLDISNTVEYWLHEVDKFVDYKQRVVCLVGTKSDLCDNTSMETIQSFVQEKYSPYLFFCTSAKKDTGVVEMFEHSIGEAIDRDQAVLDGTDYPSTPSEASSISDPSPVPEKTFFQKLCTIL